MPGELTHPTSRPLQTRAPSIQTPTNAHRREEPSGLAGLWLPRSHLGSPRMTAAARQPEAWTVEHVETESLEDAQREDAVSALATLINTWNELQRPTRKTAPN